MQKNIKFIFPREEKKLHSNKTDFSSINDTLKDKYCLKQVKKIIAEKKKLKPKYIVVIGIGGSNLGTKAIEEALLGNLYNETTEKTKILYADTTDSNYISDILTLIEKPLKNKENIILNLISKSGSTTESIANFEVLFNLLKKYKKKPENYVVVTTEKGSQLYLVAVKNKYSVLTIPKDVIGRYSVFTSVGLFPLGMLGLNINMLLTGAKKGAKRLKEANKLASFAYHEYKKNKNIEDMFLFANSLESLGKWCRQLTSESIGKDKKGITPTVSIGSTDLHSMAQLDIAGPADKYFIFVTVDEKKKLAVHEVRGFSEIINLKNKKVSDIMDAIYYGTIQSFKKNNKRHIEVIIPKLTEYSVAEFMQIFMMKTICLASLLKVNPFNQPEVEEYKREAKKRLVGNV